MLNQLGDLLNKYTTNITNTANIVNTANINNDDDDDAKERRILNLLIKEVKKDELTNKFRPTYLFIYIFTKN